MSRILIVAVGVLLWSGFVGVTLQRIETDPVGPILAMIIVGTGVAWWHRRDLLARISRRAESSQPAGLTVDPDRSA